MSAIDPGHLADEDSLITPPHNDDNPCRTCPVMERICDDEDMGVDPCAQCAEHEPRRSEDESDEEWAERKYFGSLGM